MEKRIYALVCDSVVALHKHFVNSGLSQSYRSFSYFNSGLSLV